MTTVQFHLRGRRLERAACAYDGDPFFAKGLPRVAARRPRVLAMNPLRHRLGISDDLDATSRAQLGVDSSMRVDGLTDERRGYLVWHRARVFERWLKGDEA